MDYITTEEVSKKWCITKRRVQVLCGQGRVEGAVRMGVFWIIPKDAEKPKDARKEKTDI